MNTIWSDYIQKTGTLYLTRQLRFADVLKEKSTNVSVTTLTNEQKPIIFGILFLP